MQNDEKRGAEPTMGLSAAELDHLQKQLDDERDAMDYHFPGDRGWSLPVHQETLGALIAQARSARAASEHREPGAGELREALQAMVEAYWRGSEDSDDEHAPHAVKLALAALKRTGGANG